MPSPFSRMMKSRPKSFETGLDGWWYLLECEGTNSADMFSAIFFWQADENVHSWCDQPKIARSMLFLHKFYSNKRDFLHIPFPVLCISFTFVWPVNHYCLRNLLQPDKSFQYLQGWFSIRSGLLGRLLKLLVRYKVTGEIGIFYPSRLRDSFVVGHIA